MDKLTKITAFLLLAGFSQRSAEDDKQIGPIVARLLLNEVAPLARDEDIELDELEDYHYGMTQLVADCAMLQAFGYVEARHSKKIIKDCWNFPYVGFDLVQYARATKIFEEAGDAELLAIVRAVIADPASAKAVEQIKEGKDKAIGALVGSVMKKIKGDPKKIKEMLAKEMGVTLSA